MSKKYFLPLLFLFCAPFLAACSTITNGPSQQVNFKTVGAENAYCDILIGANNYKYNVRPPQSIWVQRSRKPMFISCVAPGNRTKNAVIESGIINSAYLNGVTAGTTLALDAESGAMYAYPEDVVIDFSSVFEEDKPLPSYENKTAYEDAAFQEALDAANAKERQRRIDAVEGGFYGDKGDPVVKKANPEVEIAPLSEAVPSSIATKTLTARPLTPEDDSIAVPQTNPKLGKQIFPDSNTF